MPKTTEIKNKLILGENLDILKTIKNEGIDLIYIDPPFFSNRNYEVIFGDEAEIRSFEDRWEGGVNVYVEWMKERVTELYRVLKPTGSFYLHCDWHASHHLRVMLDEVFGAKHFQNEIIWAYRTGGATQKRWSRKHDNIYFYTKTDNYTFNPQKEKSYMGVDYNTGNKNVVLYDDKDGLGKYTLVNAKDWWEIGMMATSSKERLGYPTQKPEALLEKIIKASSNKGNIVLDSFCGCGTSLAVAQKLNRHWVGIDISPTAIKLVERRLNTLGARKDTYITINTPTTEEDLKAFKPFEFQNWVIDELQAKHSRTTG